MQADAVNADTVNNESKPRLNEARCIQNSSSAISVSAVSETAAPAARLARRAVYIRPPPDRSPRADLWPEIDVTTINAVTWSISPGSAPPADPKTFESPYETG